MADIQPFAGMSQEETLQHLLTAVIRLIDNVGTLSPDALGRLRVAAETVANINTVSTVTTVTTVTTVSTLSNQTSIGGFNATNYIPMINLLSEEQLRRNIVVT